MGVPAAFTEEVADPLGELLGRYARTHTPFTTADAAARFGLGLRVTADVLGRLAVDGRLVRGDFVAAARRSGAVRERAVVRRRRVAHPAAAFAGGAARAGRAGEHRRLRAVPAGLAPVSPARRIPAWTG